MDERDVNRENKLDQRLFVQPRNWSFALGIGMLILGIILISLSTFSTLLTVIVFGIILSARGLIDIVQAFSAFREKGFWWRLFSGILSFVVGVLVFTQPLLSAATITLMAAIYLLTSGIFRAIAAPMEHEPQWGWLTVEGVVSFLLGIILLFNLPLATIWFIGTLVGIEIISQGIVMLSLPFASKTPRTTGRPSGEAFAR